jgi:hypothetical protein
MQPVINTYLDLCNVYLRLDLPNTALDLLTEGRYVSLCSISASAHLCIPTPLIPAYPTSPPP